MENTLESVKLTQKISDEINNQTFHHHYYILFDLAKEFGNKPMNYVEIGCYAGGSACLMLQRPNTNVISIDLGKPISPEVVKNNANKMNLHGNQYNYIQGNSQTVETLNKVKELVDTVDLLFIDGDHKYGGVVNDFNLYSSLVKSGGYIVFDDYNDHIYSPEVRIAVDDLMKTVDNYKIIGCMSNIYGARPAELKEGNCFIIKKI